MKVCYLTHTFNPRTGAGVFSNYLLDYTRRLVPDVEFSIMTSEDYLASNLLRLLRNWLNIRKKLKEADVVHILDAYPYGVIAYLANWGIGRPLIITAVGSGSLQQLSRRGWRSWLLRWTYRRADVVIVISRYVARELLKYLPDLKVTVINHGVDVGFWRTKTASRLDFLLVSYRPYVLTVGELKRRKGYSLILPIIQQARLKVPDLKYVIIADTGRNQNYYEELRGLISKLGLGEVVQFLSGLTREELRAVYQRARAFILLPQNVGDDVEGFGLVLLEAAASGLPMVIGRGSGADDAVAPGQSGILIESSAPDKIVDCLVKLVTDDVLRKNLSAGAKIFAESMSWEKQIKKYVAIYQKFQS